MRAGALPQAEDEADKPMLSLAKSDTLRSQMIVPSKLNDSIALTV